MPRFAKSSPEISIQSGVSAKLLAAKQKHFTARLTSALLPWTVSVAPSGLFRCRKGTHGWRRGLHCFAASRLPDFGSRLPDFASREISMAGSHATQYISEVGSNAMRDINGGIERDLRYQRWGSKATFTRTLVSESAGVYFHFLTALTAHSARIGLPPTTEIVSTEPPGETTISRRTMPPM